LQLPNGEVQFVPHARNYRGFLVQRQYMGLGQPRYRYDPSMVGRVGRLWEMHDAFAPRHRPVLYSAALAATGLDYQTVSAWISLYGDEVFDHPTYSGLCLRWGPNAYGYHVEPAEQESIGEVDAVSFTLHTEGLTGRTHYHLQTPLTRQDPLLRELRTNAGLQFGGDKEYPNVYSTQDYAAAYRLVSARGYEWVWQQRYSRYTVTVAFSGSPRPFLHACFATAEEARQWYDYLPDTTAMAATCPVATLSRAEKLEDEQFAYQRTAQKYLPSGWQANELPVPTGPAASVARRSDFTAWDLPPSIATTTVAGLLDAKGLSLGELGRRVGIYHPTMYKRAQNPRAWTVDNLLAIAKFTQRPVGELVELIVQELDSRQV
jgi:hypothetical protein